MIREDFVCQLIHMCDDVLGVLRPAQDALDDHVCQHLQARLVLGACRHTLENDAPHQTLVESLARVVGEHQASIAEPIPLRRAFLLSGDGAGNGVQILSLLARKMKVWVYHPVLEESDPGYAKRDVKPGMEELTRHVGDGVFGRCALGAHVREHLTKMRWIAQEQLFHCLEQGAG